MPDDSGPYISITLPFGKPPIPKPISKPREPVGIDSISTTTPSVPSFIIEPLPNDFSICVRAVSSALFFVLSDALSLSTAYNDLSDISIYLSKILLLI